MAVKTLVRFRHSDEGPQENEAEVQRAVEATEGKGLMGL